MNNLPYIKHTHTHTHTHTPTQTQTHALTHTHTHTHTHIYVSKTESRNPVFICSHLVLVNAYEGYESALSGTAEDTAIKTHLRGIFGLVAITESTFVDNMFSCRQKLSLSLLYIFVQRNY